MQKPFKKSLIGSITKSQEIIDQALDLEREGKQMQMCRALQELEQRGMEAGEKVGREAGIESGRKELLKQQVQKKLSKGKSLEVIADELEEEPATIQRIIEELQSEE